jgi:uncharacterized protein (TIGR00266 family)
MAIGGHQVGPVTQDEIIANLRNGSIDAETLVFAAGMTNWQKVREVSAFAPFVAQGFSAGPMPPPSPPGRRAHDIDFVIHGNEMQFVEVELDPGEAAVAEAGSFMYMTPGIQMETIFGDGSQAPKGVLDALLGAGKRILTGESLFMTVFTATAGGGGKQKVAFGAPYPGKIIPMDLRALGGHLVCQKDSFLCAARGVSVGIAFQKKLGVGLFGGEGFIMQKLEGDGLCFVHAGGTIHHFDLAAGETMRVDTGCLVALQRSVNYDIQFVGGIKTALFGGEGIFFATLQGPGRVWLQSLPLSRMADRIYSAAPQSKGWRKEEGSILDRVGGLGDLIDGR